MSPEFDEFDEIERNPERPREGVPGPRRRTRVPGPRLALAAAVAVFLAAFFVLREVPPAAERALAAYPAGSAGVPELRVALVRSPEGVGVAVTGPFRLNGASGEEIVTQNSSLAPARVRRSGGGLAVGETRLPRHAWLEFVPSVGAEVRLDGTPLPGSLRVVREDGAGGRASEGAPPGVAAVALVDAERYACAALAATADWRSWSDETLAAHAVAIRTHALYRRATARGADAGGGDAAGSTVMGPPGGGWDFEEPGILRQMREGAHRSARVALAVNRTRGLVLTWDHRLFPAYITQACGGRTEDASRVFTASSITPLSPVECPYCLKVPFPKSSWSAKLRLETIAERLRPYAEAGGRYRLGSVRHVEVVTAPGSARAEAVHIVAAFGPCSVPAETFREAVGRDKLPSALFTIEEVGPDTVEFRGRGEGHGVGMCQHGAEQMAREGRGFRDILGHYYPGARLARLPYARRKITVNSPADSRR